MVARVTGVLPAEESFPYKDVKYKEPRKLQKKKRAKVLDLSQMKRTESLIQLLTNYICVLCP